MVETLHDEWRMSPSFSSLDRFLAAACDSDEWVESPGLEDDPESPYACLMAAEATLKRNDVEHAASLLVTATAALPEFGAAQWLLSRQMSRLGRVSEAYAAARAAVLSPPCFGGASAGALAWLRRQTRCPAEFADDPLWGRRGELVFRFGGAKDNPDYPVLQELIAGYRKAGLGVQAMLLLQTYGELMFQETVSFQERHGFSVERHIEAQLRLGLEVGVDRSVRMETAP